MHKLTFIPNLRKMWSKMYHRWRNVSCLLSLRMPVDSSLFHGTISLGIRLKMSVSFLASVKKNHWKFQANLCDSFPIKNSNVSKKYRKSAIKVHFSVGEMTKWARLLRVAGRSIRQCNSLQQIIKGKYCRYYTFDAPCLRSRLES